MYLQIVFFAFFNVLTIALAISLIVGISLFQQGSKISEQKDFESNAASYHRGAYSRTDRSSEKKNLILKILYPISIVIVF